MADSYISHFQGSNHSESSFGATILKMFSDGPYLLVLT